jgi:hypothetical protein
VGGAEWLALIMLAEFLVMSRGRYILLQQPSNVPLPGTSTFGTHIHAKTAPEPFVKRLRAEHRSEVWFGTELANRYPQLNNLQIIGTIIAIDINYRQKAGYLKNVGRKIGHHAISRGVLLIYRAMSCIRHP